jgi:hypothetical protein
MRQDFTGLPIRPANILASALCIGKRDALSAMPETSRHRQFHDSKRG